MTSYREADEGREWTGLVPLNLRSSELRRAHQVVTEVAEVSGKRLRYILIRVLLFQISGPT